MLLDILAIGFVFTDVQAWRFSEARQERIPALEAVVDNGTGEDWIQARFRVTVGCSTGDRSYVITLGNLEAGRQKVAATAFDAIGEVEPCDGPASITFLDGQKVPAEQRASYVILGFTYEPGDLASVSHLEGVMEHRRYPDGRLETRARWIDGEDSRFEKPGEDGVAYYALKVEPGEFGLSGFLLNRDAKTTGPLDRFLRFYDVPPGTAVYLGRFALYRAADKLVGARIEPSPEMVEWIKQKFGGTFHGRPIVTTRGRKPPASNFTSIAR